MKDLFAASGFQISKIICIPIWGVALQFKNGSGPTSPGPYWTGMWIKFPATLQFYSCGISRIFYISIAHRVPTLLLTSQKLEMKSLCEYAISLQELSSLNRSELLRGNSNKL